MYNSTYTPGAEVLAKTGYSIDSHGSLSNTASYLITNDFPEYAGMFYSPTEHEVISSIKYGNFSQDYSNVREIQQSLNGPPLEFYVPHSIAANDGVGRNDIISLPESKIKDLLLEKVQKEALKEIAKATASSKIKKIKIVETEEVMFYRKKKRSVIIEKR